MTRRFWTDEEVAKLVEWYSDRKTAWIAEQLGRDPAVVYRKANDLGLRKSREFLASEASGRLQQKDHRGRLTQFKKGLTPWNKGTHYQAGGRSAETRFKKGHRSGVALTVYQPIGAERITKDGYLQRKVNEDFPFQRRWKMVHVIVWEEANGPMPTGHAVCFRDGDKRNFALDNLELVSRAALMARNTVHRLPKEVAQLVQLRGALVRQINKRLRNKA